MKMSFFTGRKIRIIIASACIAAVSVFSYSFKEDYFELSKNIDIFVTLFREVNMYYVDELQPGTMWKT